MGICKHVPCVREWRPSFVLSVSVRPRHLRVSVCLSPDAGVWACVRDMESYLGSIEVPRLPDTVLDGGGGSLGSREHTWRWRLGCVMFVSHLRGDKRREEAGLGAGRSHTA